MANPFVSVIIPAYNAEKFIVDALDSIFAQTYRPIQIIVIDDGSNDRTAKIVRSYQTSRSSEAIEQIELQYIYQENGGPSKARNSGIKVAKGKYLAFLDSDDMWPQSKLSLQGKMMKRHPEVSLLFGDSQRFSETIANTPSMFQANSYGKDFFGNEFYVLDAYKKIITCGNFITTGSVIVRRDALESVGLFDESLKYSEDVDFWLRIALKYPVAYTDNLCLVRRIHKANLSVDSEKMYLGFVDVIRKHAELFKTEISTAKINVRRCIQHKYYELALLLYVKNRISCSRKYFLKCMRYGAHLRAAFYLFKSFIPSRFRIRNELPSGKPRGIR